MTYGLQRSYEMPDCNECNILGECTAERTCREIVYLTERPALHYIMTYSFGVTCALCNKRLYVRTRQKCDCYKVECQSCKGIFLAQKELHSVDCDNCIVGNRMECLTLKPSVISDGIQPKI